jgi:outer membrane protein TolC
MRLLVEVNQMRSTLCLPLSLAIAALAACSGPRPKGEADEREAAAREGVPYVTPHVERKLPALPEAATLPDVLHYGFLSNAKVEQAYFEWKAALERIPQAVSYDDPKFSFEYLFSKEQMSSWDRTTLGASQMIPFPGKLDRAGRAALEEAIAARRRFEDAKFALQAEIVDAFQQLALVDRVIAIDEENVRLLADFVETTATAASVGKAAQPDLLKAELELETGRNELQAARAERPGALARLNALLSRSARSPLVARTTGPLAPLPGPDDVLLALAAERNRELEALAAEVRGREEALELARLQYLPDFEIAFSLQGAMEKMLGAMITAPLRRTRIRAGIDEAGALLRAAQAALRAHRDDVGAQVVLQIFLARDTERQARLFEETLIPKAGDIVDATEAGYSAGGASFLDLLDAQRSLLELRTGLAQVVAAHEQAVAALEALCALDFGARAGKETDR